MGLPAGDSRRFLDSGEAVEEIARSDRRARHLGVTGVPFFVVNRRYALSGAQPPEVIIEMLDLVAQDVGADPSLNAAALPEGASAAL